MLFASHTRLQGILGFLFSVLLGFGFSRVWGFKALGFGAFRV